MKVIRLIIYEGDYDWLEEQLMRSLPEGVRKVGKRRTITVKTLFGIKFSRIEREMQGHTYHRYRERGFTNIVTYPSGVIFWDEVEVDWYGPYPSIHAAKAAMLDYISIVLERRMQ